MYEGFYHLRERPFSLLPDPDYLYLSEKHQMALALLEYSLANQAGFCVISGETGAGKTTLIRHLLNLVDSNITVGLITNTHQSFDELLRWILMAFGLDYVGKSKVEMYQVFIDFLIDEYAKNRHTVLIVDEAQNTSVDTLEELRMLSNINADKDQILQILLVGQQALRDTLKQPELEQFAQRIAVDYHLESLNQEETRAYIHHRLTVADGDPGLFHDEACREVYRYSGGTPRLINLLCDTALVYGYAEQSPVINSNIIRDVVSDRQASDNLPTIRDTDTIPTKDDIVTAKPLIDSHGGSKRPASSSYEINAQVKDKQDIESSGVATHKREKANDLADFADAIDRAIERRRQAGKKAEHPQPVTPATIRSKAGAKTPTLEKSVAGAGDAVIGRERMKPPTSETLPPDSEEGADSPAVKPLSLEEESIDTTTPLETMKTSSAKWISFHKESGGKKQISIKQESRIPEKGEVQAQSTFLVLQRLRSEENPKWMSVALFVSFVGIMASALLGAYVYFSGPKTEPDPVQQAIVNTGKETPPMPVEKPAMTVLDNVRTTASSEDLRIKKTQLSAIVRERDAALAQIDVLERERAAAVALIETRKAARKTNRAVAVPARKQSTVRNQTIKAAKAIPVGVSVPAITGEKDKKAVEVKTIVTKTDSRITDFAPQEPKYPDLIDAPKELATAVFNQTPVQESVFWGEEDGATNAGLEIPSEIDKTPSGTGGSSVIFTANPCQSAAAIFLSTCKE